MQKIIDEIQAFADTGNPIHALGALRAMDEQVATTLEESEALRAARRLLAEAMKTKSRHTMNAAADALRIAPPAHKKAKKKNASKKTKPSRKKKARRRAR